MRRDFTRPWSTPPRDMESRANAAIAIRRAAHCARHGRRADHKGGPPRPFGTPWMWTLAFGPRGPHADARLQADARGRYGGVRQVMAAGVSRRKRWKQPASCLLEPARLSAHGVVPCHYAPSHGSAYDSHHRTAGIAGCTRRRGGRVAARGARAAGGKTADHWVPGPD